MRSFSFAVIILLFVAAPASAQDDPSFEGYDFEAPIDPGNELESSIPEVEPGAYHAQYLLSWRAHFVRELLLSLEAR